MDSEEERLQQQRDAHASLCQGAHERSRQVIHRLITSLLRVFVLGLAFLFESRTVGLNPFFLLLLQRTPLFEQRTVENPRQNKSNK